jgi:molybdenum cofactor cytidylyltransferase
MGRPKQLLPFRGRSLLRHAAEVALAADCEPVIVILGTDAARLRGELDDLAVAAVENAEWADGPGTSVRVGVAAAEDAGTDAVVFLLCDQPLVDAEHVRRLVAAQRESGLPMAASGYSGTVGVPAVFARQCFVDLRVLAPTAGAKQLLARAPDAVAVVPFPGGAVDLDTPADYEQFTTGEDHGHRQ